MAPRLSPPRTASPPGPSATAARVGAALAALGPRAGAAELTALLQAQLSVDTVRLEGPDGRAHAHTGGPVSMEHRLALAGGHALVSSAPLALDDETRGLVSGWWAAWARLRDHQDLVGILAHAGHEFRNLDAVQRNGLILVREDIEDGCLDEGFALECIGDALSAGLRNRDLLQRLAGMAATLRAAPVAVELAPLEATVARRLEQAELRTGLRWDQPDDLPPVRAVERELAELVVDLVRNSDQAGAGSVTVSLGLAGDHAVRLVVADDGAGMPPDVQDRATEAWFTTGGVRERWGMGLAHLQLRVACWGGHLALGPHGSHGTAVTVTLPVWRA